MEHRDVAESDIRTTPGTNVALTIAGSDSSGGAGIQADLKVFAVLEVFGAAVVTVITAQNTRGIKRSFALDPELVEAQIDAVASDITIHATKTGMLANADIVATVAKAVDRHSLFPLVVDPVMLARSGDSLLEPKAVEVLVKKLVPLAALVTPNAREAARLLGWPDPVADVSQAGEAAAAICRDLGARACVVKGIKRPNAEEGEAVDVFFDGQEALEVVSAWRPTENTHGSGCTFSAAIAAALAREQPLGEAIQTAKNVVSEAIRRATSLGHGPGPVNHVAYLDLKR